MMELIEIGKVEAWKTGMLERYEWNNGRMEC
jgi:hypothetical protein